MIAATQKENFKEEKVTEKFSIISNRISDYRLKPRDLAVYCRLVKHSDKNGVCDPFFFSAVKLKVLHKSAVVFEEVHLIPQKTQRYENKQEKAEGVRCFPSAAHSGRQRRLPGALCDILKLLIKPRFMGCSNFILADLGVALFTAKTAA